MGLAVLALDHFAADFLRDDQQLAALEVGADQLDGHNAGAPVHYRPKDGMA